MLCNVVIEYAFRAASRQSKIPVIGFYQSHTNLKRRQGLTPLHPRQIVERARHYLLSGQHALVTTLEKDASNKAEPSLLLTGCQIWAAVSEELFTFSAMRSVNHPVEADMRLSSYPC